MQPTDKPDVSFDEATGAALNESPNQPDGAFDELRRKFTRFRVLVIGRANAGKTTILKKMCETTENPIVRNKDGKRVGRPAEAPRV